MRLSITIIFAFVVTVLTAQIESPSTFLGYEIGTQFTRHADAVRYFEHVAANSNMIKFDTYGKTYENRPLTYAIISSPENIVNIETIRTDHLKNAGLLEGDASPQIAIVWLSYNVHGNESSSMEAAMVTLYELLSLKKEWLENTVVIIDPCLNPDGRDRYANWYNQVKATPYDISQDASEHNEPWPGGRSNHYLFDLNRDWAWATQIESQHRLKIYNKWMPHVHVDFHEQGINEPYYFAPAAEPYHEIISPWQRNFQTEIGKNNAKYFDEQGWLFFTRERFDLLYPSYGDTYPTFMGAIGMTYEQAGNSRAGLGIETDEENVLTLVDRVAHQNTTGLSTIEISSKNAQNLNREFKKFFDTSKLKYKSYVLKGTQDKIHSLTKLLDRHEIKYGFSSEGKVKGYDYIKHKTGVMDAEGALVVSSDQPKGKMVKALFEPDAKLSDPLTYDITAWNIPHAFGLEAIASSKLIPANSQNPFETKTNLTHETSPGYIAKWNSIQDAAFLADLLQQGVKVRFSEKDLSFNGKEFPRGSLVITKGDNLKKNNFHAVVNSIANNHSRDLFASPTSFSDNGTDFGSGDVKLIRKKRIAMLKDEPVYSLNFGALWHFFEQQLKYPVTSINASDFERIDLSKYDVIILPEGRYNKFLNESNTKTIKEWVSNGGKLISIGQAVKSFKDKEGFGISMNTEKDDTEDESKEANLIPYDQRENDRTKNFITGSIYKVSLDSSHPLAFGYGSSYFSLKNDDTSIELFDKGYNVGYIGDEVISVSGFSGEEAKNGLKNSLVFGEVKLGKGSLVYLVDNVLFRSFWENGKLFLVNSIFFVNTD